MTFVTLQTELQNRIGIYDMTVTAELTQLKRWINMAIQYICGKRLWPFMLAGEIVQTVADYTTGTATVSAAGTTVTFSGTITPSKTNHYIQFASSDDWYKISAHTSGTSTATITPAAISANTSAAFTIRKLHYVTTTPLIQIIDMKQMISPIQIKSISSLAGDYFLPLYNESGVPFKYIMSTPDSSGTPQWSLYPSPDSVINLMVRGIKALADLSSDSDVPVIPVPWHDAIVNIAAFYGFQAGDDTRAKMEFDAGELRIADMSQTLSHDLGRHRVMQPSDNQSSSDLEWILPSQYGPPVS